MYNNTGKQKEPYKNTGTRFAVCSGAVRLFRLLRVNERHPDRILKGETKMGFYSNAVIEKCDTDTDRGYPSPGQQLLWRLEDLRDRLPELQKNNAPFSSGAAFLPEDCAYAPANLLSSVQEAESAIAFAEERLYKYDELERAEAEMIPGQLTIVDVLPMNVLSGFPNAAA